MLSLPDNLYMLLVGFAYMALSMALESLLLGQPDLV